MALLGASLSSVVNHLLMLTAIIRADGLHHAGHLYMICLLMCLLIAPFCLSAACLHYVRRLLGKPVKVLNDICKYGEWIRISAWN